MMDIFSRRDLRTLIDAQASPSVSVFMPTARKGREVRQGMIRCKNILDEVVVKLQEMGLRRPEALEILEPIERLRTDEFFWTHQSDGLAMFAAKGQFHRFRVPVDFDDLYVVGQRFHVKPLLPVLEGDGQFYLLAVSQQKVNFYQGTRFNISQLVNEALPTSLVEALNIDEYVESLQVRSFTSFGVGAAGASQGMFHGQGASDLNVRKKDEIREFFLRIDDGLQEFFGEESAPLVFAGVEYLFPIFRETCSYRSLVDEPVRGNPDGLHPKQLHQMAWQVVEPIFRQDRQTAMEQYGLYAARGLASTNLAEIIKAAQQGRVDTLFVAHGKECWGTIDESTGQVVDDGEPKASNEDLVNRATSETILQGGKVFTTEPDQLPAGEHAAAMFRFSIPAQGGNTSPATGTT